MDSEHANFESDHVQWQHLDKEASTLRGLEFVKTLSPVLLRFGVVVGKGWQWTLVLHPPPVPSPYFGHRLKFHISVPSDYTQNTTPPIVRLSCATEHPFFDPTGFATQDFYQGLKEVKHFRCLLPLSN